MFGYWKAAQRELTLKSHLNRLLKKLKALDAQFEYRNPALDDTPWFKSVTGPLPVLVSAPHACMHRRNGIDKMQEEYTGALALYLAESCHCSAIAISHKISEDPNWDETSDYKTAVRSLVQENKIKFLIDLHGMSIKNNMGVAIGTIKGRACAAESVVPHFIDSGFVCDEDASQPKQTWRSLVIDHPKFTGGLVNQTLTRFASEKLDIQAVQVELSPEVRVVEYKATPDWPHDYYGDPSAIEATVTALQSLVMQYQ